MKSKEKRLLKVGKLTEAFQGIIGRVFKNDAPVEQKLLIAVPAAKLKEVKSRIERTAVQSLRVDFGGKPDAAYARRNIKAAEEMADIYSRVIQSEQLSNLIPKKLKKKKNVALLRKLGARKLADLCQ